jgi:hypothetical protein
MMAGMMFLFFFTLYTHFFLLYIIRPTPLVAIGNPKGWRNDDYEEGELPRKVSSNSQIIIIIVLTSFEIPGCHSL